MAGERDPAVAAEIEVKSAEPSCCSHITRRQFLSLLGECLIVRYRARVRGADNLMTGTGRLGASVCVIGIQARQPNRRDQIRWPWPMLSDGQKGAIGIDVPVAYTVESRSELAGGTMDE